MEDSATLKSQYLAQIEADLERIAREKERVATDLAALQEQLAALDQDHALLVKVQQVVGTPPSPAQDTDPVTGAPADAPLPAVPGSRKPKAAHRTSRPSTARAKTAAAPGTGASLHAPTLVELVITDLTGHSEPRSAAEVATALAQAHPGRKIQTTVVRNTLEALVAKGQGQRSKQGRSVYYTAAETVPAPEATVEPAACP